MKPVNKQALVDSLESHVERQLSEVIKLFQNETEPFLNRPAPDGGWSIAQCLEHLNSYGHYYLPLIGQGLQDSPKTDAAESFTSTWLGSYMNQIMDPKTGRKKHQAFKAHIPALSLEAHQVVAEFIDQQEKLLTFLRLSRQADLNAIRLPISISRWVKLRLGDVLQFLIAHQERHLLQAKRHLP
jgi:uncharacterized damage-inducible protein DinB